MFCGDYSRTHTALFVAIVSSSDLVGFPARRRRPFTTAAQCWLSLAVPNTTLSSFWPKRRPRRKRRSGGCLLDSHRCALIGLLSSLSSLSGLSVYYPCASYPSDTHSPAAALSFSHFYWNSFTHAHTNFMWALVVIQPSLSPSTSSPALAVLGFDWTAIDSGSWQLALCRWSSWLSVPELLLRCSSIGTPAPQLSLPPNPALQPGSSTRRPTGGGIAGYLY